MNAKTKKRFRVIHLAETAEITAIDSESLISHIFIDTSTDYPYYVHPDGTARIFQLPAGGASNLSIGTITGTTVDIDNDNGSGVTLPGATKSQAGLISGASQSKLDDIEANAEVNNISDVNATDLTDAGDSALHYHSADRSRANHTGTQTASTISDFDTEVSNNTSVSTNTTHRGLTNNPHNTDIGNLGSGTLAELNSIITDATLDDNGDSRPPTTSDDIITHFEVEDDGSTGQATTTTPTVLTAMWGTPGHTNSDYSWNGTNGRLTFNTAGKVVVDVSAVSYQTAGNRHELHLRLLHWNGSSLSVVAEYANYASRNGTQDEGGAVIAGKKIDVGVNDYIVAAVYHVGVAATVGATQVANQTRISATLFK